MNMNEAELDEYEQHKKSDWAYIDEDYLLHYIDDKRHLGWKIISVQRTRRLLHRCYFVFSIRK